MSERPISIGDTYSLTPDERDEIKAIAKERTSSNRSAGVRDAGIGPSSGLFKDMVGAAGEWAFAKLGGTVFDDTISPRSFLRGEDRGDTTYRGAPVDIKSTHYTTGKLAVVPWRGQSGERFVYGLMIMTSRDGPTFEFRGFADAVTVKSHPSDLGHGMTYAVPQKFLVDWFLIEQFQHACDNHGVIACLECPDPFWPEAPTAVAEDVIPEW